MALSSLRPILFSSFFFSLPSFSSSLLLFCHYYYFSIIISALSFWHYFAISSSLLFRHYCFGIAFFCLCYFAFVIISSIFFVIAELGLFFLDSVFQPFALFKIITRLSAIIEGLPRSHPDAAQRAPF